jgi:uncharacterized protein (UPF0147 family)
VGSLRGFARLIIKLFNIKISDQDSIPRNLRQISLNDMQALGSMGFKVFLWKEPAIAFL